MAEINEKTLDSKDKIQILLKEYDTLRAEIIARTNHGFQLTGLGGAVLMWLVSRPDDARFWVLVATFLMVFGYMGWITFRDISKAAGRIRQIEAKVNKLAGDELLEWETLWGGAVAGYLMSSRPLPAKSSDPMA
jgi:hypothetical protein